MIRALLQLRSGAVGGRILGCLYGGDTVQERARDRDVWRPQRTERFQEWYHRAWDVVDGAPDGPWIAAREWAFRDALLQRMKERYPAGLQSQGDAHPTAPAAAFFPCESRVDGSASSV